MKNVETVYSLSPLQHGLLFHSLAEPESRVYQQQLRVGIQGRLDEGAFRQAWEMVVQRHPVLRTGFLWEGLDDAYQVVYKSAPVRLTSEDWRGRAVGEAQLDEFCQQMQQQALDLTRAPLQQLCLIRLGDTHWHFVWTHHHIVLDGWSVGLVLRDWFDAYGALTGGMETRFRPVRPFQDYIAWLGEQDADSARVFWQQQLADFAEPTPLPRLDAIAPAQLHLAAEAPYAEQCIELDEQTGEALGHFTRQEALTPATLVAAAWGLLLARYAGRDEALFGLTVSGRPSALPGAEDMVGLFINTLPLRVPCPGQTPVRDWLAQVQHRSTELQERCHTPLSTLKALSQVADGRDLFESIVVFENFPFDATLADGAAGLLFTADQAEDAPVRYTAGRNNYPLTLVVVPGRRLELRLCYRRSLLSDAAATQILEHLRTLILALMSQVDRPLHQLGWLDAREAARLADWGHGASLPLEDVTLGHLVERHALQRPTAPALATVERSWTYAELNRAADGAASHLARALAARVPAGPAVIALALPRSAEFIIAVLACWKIGAAYLPLDPQQPPARLRQILDDSEAAVLVAAPASADALGFSSCVSPETLMAVPTAQVAVRPSVACADDGAYVIYTSGSTGLPKGVRVSHRAASAYAQGLVKALQLPADGAGLRFGLISTVAADLGLTSVFGAWASGGCLCLPKEEAGFDPLHFASQMQILAVDVLKITPSHLRGLLDALEQRAVLPRAQLIFGGEALDAALVHRVQALAPELKIINHYGPTEAVIGAVFRAAGGALPPRGPLPLGRPLPNRELRVVDASGASVPCGVPGELWIGGTGLADGYLGRPEMNSERFVQVEGGRYYRTGDRVRWTIEGELQFLGRVDRQVKLRGYRIELGEIESRVRDLSPHIEQVLVRLVEQDGIAQLAACIVARTAVSLDKLRQDLAQAVPDYMVPAAWMTLDALPLNANGKIDEERLPRPGAIAGIGDEYVAPRDDLEQTLVDIWQQVLKRDRIGVHDNFFRLGGDSILNLQIITRAQQRGLRLSPKQVFEQRTIAALAASLRAVDAPAAAADRALPLSAGQQERLQAAPLHASWRCLRLHKPVTVQTLSAAVQAVQAHHPALSLGLSTRGDGWSQMRSTAITAASATRHVPAAAPLQVVADRLLAQLDSARGETLHVALLDGEVPRVLVLAHPLVLDDAAWPGLLYDLSLAIEQIDSGKVVRLSYTGGQPDDWLEAQQSRARSDALEDTWEEWLQYAGQQWPRLSSPTTDRAVARQMTLGPQTSAHLDTLRRQLGAGWQMLLAMAVAQHVSESLDSPDVLLDLTAGRPPRHVLPRTGPLARLDNDPQRMLGCLSHRLPLFLHWPQQDTPLRQLQYLVRRLQALPLQGADFGAARYLSDDRLLLEPLLSLPQAQIGIADVIDETGHLDPNAALGAVVERSLPVSPHDLHVTPVWDGVCLHLELQGPLADAWHDALAARLEMLAALADATPHTLPLAGVSDLAAEALESLPVDWAQVETVLPLTPTQQGLLLESRLAAEHATGTVPYQVQHQYEWRGPLDHAALQLAWTGLQANHEILRSGFVWCDSLPPLQVVYHRCDASIPLTDWRGRDDAAQALPGLLDAERSRTRLLEQAPLDRLRIIQLGDEHFLLVRSYHHIISDAWSFGLLIEELFERYEAARQHRAGLQAKSRPYRDYQHWVGRQGTAEAEAYWRRALDGLSGPVSLPLVTPRRHGAAAAVAQHEAWLGVQQTSTLVEAARAAQTTLNTWLQAAWALLLARYCDTEDVIFGATVAGRPAQLAGMDRTVGLFINTLPLRVTLDPQQTLAQMLQALLTHNLAQREFEFCALSDITRWAGLPGGQSLFDTVVVFENAPDAGAQPAGDYRIDLLHDDSPTHYPLTLMVMPGNRLGLRLSYDTSRVEGPAAERLLAHLQHLLLQMPGALDQPVQQLELLTAAERRQILSDWNRSEVDFPLDRSYAQLLAAQVQRQRHKVAAVCGADSLTFEQLDQRSNAVAHALVAAGACPDCRVALLADRGLDLLVMLVATLKAGAAFQALDTALPPGRLGELLQLGGAPILMATRRAARHFPALRATHTLLLEDIEPHTAANPPAVVSAPHHLAYVVFTSGSTGVPKGAMVEQRSLLNNLFGKIPALGLNECDRVAQTAALSFDIAVWQFLAAPLLGATVHILPDDIARDPRQLLAALDEQAITLAQTVPSMLRAMLDDDTDGIHLRELRWMISIGEALPPALCHRWFARFPGIPLLNLYGPAECADNIACYPLTQAPAVDASVIPVGYPTANNQLHILDSSLRPLPVGVPGEICATGAGVGRGYLDDIERTREVFLDHPWLPGARLYRTGDIGRYRADGAIEYLGRRDQQLKIRGQRIELGDIEGRIARHPAVAATAVLSRTDRTGETVLIAFWQPRPAVSADVDLRVALTEQLTAAQMPAHFIRLQALPLNVNGKTDRRALAAMALPAIEPASGAASDAEVAWSEHERRLAPLWRAVLGVDAPTPDVNFFAQGGHSLLAAQLISRVRSAFAIDLPLKTLFDRPRLADLALAIAEREAGSHPDLLAQPIVPQPRTRALPLSHAQQRLWFMEQLHGGSGRFNIPFLLRLSGPLDCNALQAAFLTLIQKHEVMRTAFASHDGQPGQAPVAIETFDLPIRALGGLDEATIRAACRDWLEQPFDLSRPPLLRAGLLRHCATEHVLAGAIHHISTDAWSQSLLVQELADLYRAHAAGDNAQFTPPPVQYADYAVWHRAYLQSGLLREQMDYWRRTLQSLPGPLHLPGRTERALGQVPAPTRHRLHVPEPVVQALDALALAQQASLFMLLNAAWTALMHLQTGRGDIVFGTDVNNRPHPACADMQGFFVNQLVLRHRVRPDQRFEELLGSARATVLSALQHQDLPFDTLVGELAPQRQTSESPLFTIKLVLQNAGQHDLTLAGIKIEELASQPAAVTLDLQLNAVRHSHNLELIFDFDAGVYPEPVVQQLGRRLIRLLEEVSRNPQLSLGELRSRLHEDSPTQGLATLLSAQRRRVPAA